jgi:hypothetical protein
MRANCFVQELSLIRNTDLRAFIAEYMEKFVPDYFYVVPASSTGKYHPKYALGEGGLVRHTKACVAIAEALLSLEQNKHLNHDRIISALIIHDSFKQGLGTSKHTKFEHPLFSANAIQLFAKEYHPNMKDEADEIAKLVITHMGEWNTSNYSKVTLPKPYTEEQKFVHMCDYLASRKNIEVNVVYEPPKEEEQQTN